MMINRNGKNTLPYIEPVPEEGRLVRRAKSRDTEAFYQLCDAYGDGLYRYIYSRVMSDAAAEGMTVQVFRDAWRQLKAFPNGGSTFATWLYELARSRILVYYQANFQTSAHNAGFLSVAADYGLNEVAQHPPNIEAWRNHLQLLVAHHERRRPQRTASQVMRRYLEYIMPGRTNRPSPTFNAYSRLWLAQFLRMHGARRKQPALLEGLSTAFTAAARSVRARVQVPRISPLFQRMALAYAVLTAVFLITGTAQAQSALPGDALYGWKLTSEQAWLSISPDPVGTSLLLADRRLSELIAVDHDPTRSAGALNNYLDALQTLSTTNNVQTRERVIPLLEAHRQRLSDSGLSNTQINAVLTNVENPTPVAAATLIDVPSSVPPATEIPTVVVAAATQPPADAAAAPSDVPTDVPTATEAPTETPPTPTEVAPTPTDIPPTDTPAPTAVDVPPTATPNALLAPTDVVP